MNLKDHFIIAMPSLDDSLFQHSVVYICEHNRKGAMGIIINKPLLHLDIQTVLCRLDITPYKECAELENPVFIGGPLAEEQGFILHSPQNGFSSSIAVSNDIMVTTSVDVLRTVGSQEQPKNMMISLGYCGWSDLQLEQEIARNDWVVAKADPSILFEYPIESRWHLAAKSIGVNIETISTQMGNA